MNELEQELFEKRLTSIAGGMEYPHTPDIAGSVTARFHSATRPRFRLSSKAVAWSLTIILLLCSSLMLIPPARAAILEFIQIGIVRIFPRSGGPITEPTRTPTSSSGAPLTTTPQVSDLPILSQIVGKTTLPNAQNQVEYAILLPTYPPNLGDPDYVYVQDAEGDMTILVWLDPQDPGKVLMSLHFIPEGSWAIDKMHPQTIEATTVNGKRALWTIGPYLLKVYNKELESVRLVTGHVLIWAEGEITYRLETDLSLEEAVKVAESLQPMP
jgi:hypothetical protein